MMAPGIAPPRSPRSERFSSDSETESCSSRRSWHLLRCQRVERTHPLSMPWPPQWQMLAQWPFWTPWAFHQAQWSYAGRLQLFALDFRPWLSHSAGSLPYGTGEGYNHSGAEGQETSMVPIRASSSSSPYEAMVGAVAAPKSDDSSVHQELLCRVAQNMDLQAEEVIKGVDPMVGLLAPEGPSRVALPLIKTTQEITKTLWQTPASVPPTTKKVERKYFVPLKNHEHLYTHPPPG